MSTLLLIRWDAEVLDRLNIHEGTIVNYHQNRRKTQNYQVDLEAMQYDILIW